MVQHIRMRQKFKWTCLQTRCFAPSQHFLFVRNIFHVKNDFINYIVILHDAVYQRRFKKNYTFIPAVVFKIVALNLIFIALSWKFSKTLPIFLSALTLPTAVYEEFGNLPNKVGLEQLIFWSWIMSRNGLFAFIFVLTAFSITISTVWSPTVLDCCNEVQL